MYIYMYIYIQIYIYIDIYIHTYKHTHTHIHAHRCTTATRKARPQAGTTPVTNETASAARAPASPRLAQRRPPRHRYTGVVKGVPNTWTRAQRARQRASGLEPVFRASLFVTVYTLQRREREREGVVYSTGNRRLNSKAAHLQGGLTIRHLAAHLRITRPYYPKVYNKAFLSEGI